MANAQSEWAKLILVSIAIGSLISLGWKLSGSGSPRLPESREIIADDNKVVFKNVSINSAAVQSLRVKNISSGRIRITDIRVSCSCTTVDIDRKILESGESAMISVRIKPDTSTKLGKLSTIFLNCSGHHNSTLEIPVFVNEVSGLTVVPPLLEFGEVGPNGTGAGFQNIYASLFGEITKKNFRIRCK